MNEFQLNFSSLLSIPHIRRFRIASKGLAVAPSRIIDGTDPWASTLVDLARQGRDMGKQVCWHTHFNHPKEITWITREAAAYLFKNGVIVRNQSVLLKGVNDTNEVMSELLGELADMNIQPVRKSFLSLPGFEITLYDHFTDSFLSTMYTNVTWFAGSKI